MRFANGKCYHGRCCFDVLNNALREQIAQADHFTEEGTKPRGSGFMTRPRSHGCDVTTVVVLRNTGRVLAAEHKEFVFLLNPRGTGQEGPMCWLEGPTDWTESSPFG